MSTSIEKLRGEIVGSNSIPNELKKKSLKLLSLKESKILSRSGGGDPDDEEPPSKGRPKPDGDITIMEDLAGQIIESTASLNEYDKKLIDRILRV